MKTLFVPGSIMILLLSAACATSSDLGVPSEGTVQGCLTKSMGTYFVRDSNTGIRYELAADNARVKAALKETLGQYVEASGPISNLYIPYGDENLPPMLPGVMSRLNDSNATPPILTVHSVEGGSAACRAAK